VEQSFNGEKREEGKAAKKFERGEGPFTPKKCRGNVKGGWGPSILYGGFNLKTNPILGDGEKKALIMRVQLTSGEKLKYSTHKMGVSREGNQYQIFAETGMQRGGTLSALKNKRCEGRNGGKKKKPGGEQKKGQELRKNNKRKQRETSSEERPGSQVKKQRVRVHSLLMRGPTANRKGKP